MVNLEKNSKFFKKKFKKILFVIRFADAMETERVKRSAYAEFSSEDFNVKLFIPSLLAKIFFK